ncbi:hypothetical protein F5J12DRAFT_782143 [Pisolithus orientalis]|uniref:uncharacterized protein n=1 Tax=Pisolithus orientalis TaxID=936130 RepID=UPI002225B44D|nr:uncharacterized protein F5J12DRAFT_782143 [Pisolithus orientalis]KAI6009652.1 hypothetical protein F5J12DRAFT_782143 [Pisolithus orientalis]
MEDIVAEQGCKKSVFLLKVTTSCYPNDSEEDEQAIESMVQAEGDLVSENLVDHDGRQAVENMMDSICHDDVEHESASDSDWSVDQRHDLKCKQTLREICAGNYDTDNHPSTPPLPSPSSSEEEEGAADTEEAQAIADEYGKTLGSIMAAAGLTTKATCAESVWNMHQAWYAHTNPKASAEETKDYYRCHTKHYEDHKDEDKHPQLWAEIQKYWSEHKLDAMWRAYMSSDV